jgi:hypothetical protein
MRSFFMDVRLNSIGYIFEPSKYTPALGYSQLKVRISGKPSQRFFDVKLLQVPTFDGRFFHHTQITRHELKPSETFQACLGELRMETYQGETMRAFLLGGNLRTAVELGDLYCELTSTAPIFQLQDQMVSVSDVLASEIMDLLAEEAVKLPGHEDELYRHLSKHDPYELFLSALVSLRVRLDNYPVAQRREGYQKVASNVKHAIQILHDTDGWDGKSPSLEQLLAE